jgi:hypothetical protein
MFGSWISAHVLFLRRAGFIAGIAFVIGMSCAPASAQQDLDAVLTRTNQLFAAGNYDGALVEARTVHRNRR